MTYRTVGVRRLIFVNNTKLNENRYTIGSGVGGKSSFVRTALCKRAQWKKDSTNNCLPKCACNK